MSIPALTLGNLAPVAGLEQAGKELQGNGGHRYNVGHCEDSSLIYAPVRCRGRMVTVADCLSCKLPAGECHGGED